MGRQVKDEEEENQIFACRRAAGVQRDFDVRFSNHSTRYRPISSGAL